MFSKNHDKKWDYRYLPEIQFVSRGDNGPLGLNCLAIMKLVFITFNNPSINLGSWMAFFNA